MRTFSFVVILGYSISISSGRSHARFESRRGLSESGSGEETPSTSATLRICSDSVHQCSSLETPVGTSCEPHLSPMHGLSSGECDVLLTNSFMGSSNHGLESIEFARKTSQSGSGYSLAVVLPDTLSSFNQIEQKNTCHGSFESSAGWFAPLAALHANANAGAGKQFAMVNHDNMVPNDVEAALEFFNSSCAPASGKLSSLLGAMSEHCGTSEGISKTATSALSHAMECLHSDGDVAFVDSRALKERLSEVADLGEKRKYSLLCPNLDHALTFSSAEGLDAAAESCNLGHLPQDSLIFSANASRARKWMIQRTLSKVVERNQEEWTSSSELVGYDRSWEPIQFVEQLRSIAYSIGHSLRLRNSCQFPVCKKMFHMEDAWEIREKR